MRQASPYCGTDLPIPRATPLHRYYHSPVGLPSCVTPSLAYYQSGSHVPPTRHHPEGQQSRSFRWLASLGSAWTLFRGYGNINPLSIDYACRPRLRSRLTLGGLAWPRNPWSSGGGVSHSPFATHACILTRVASTAGSLRRFHRHTTLPYPSTHLAQRPWSRSRLLRECHSFGGVLEPRYIVGAESLDQ
jgi:hypothetical protein